MPIVFFVTFPFWFKQLREGHDHASGDVSSVPPSMRGLLGQDGTVTFGKAQVRKKMTHPCRDFAGLMMVCVCITTCASHFCRHDE